MEIWQAAIIGLLTAILGGFGAWAEWPSVQTAPGFAKITNGPMEISRFREFPQPLVLTFAAQHTLGHQNCPGCQPEEEEMPRSELAPLAVRAAAEKWLESKRIYIQPRTVMDYRQYFSTVCQFCGTRTVQDIDLGIIRGYQQWRLSHGVGALRINHEITAFGQMLKEARVWHRIKPYYKPLPMPTESASTAISKEQSRHLFEVAGRNKRWEVALYAGILSVNTTAGPGEIRHLQLQDIDIQARTIFIRRAVKNRYRVRTLPLNDAALRAVSKLLERAHSKGARLPEHYLLPHRAQKRGMDYDPSRPQGHWYTAWDKLRKAAGLPTLRLYDLRHTAITWMLCDPTVPARVVVEIAGWVNPQMIERYSHQHIEAKRAAVRALDGLIEAPKKPAAPSAEFTFLVSPLWISRK